MDPLIWIVTGDRRLKRIDDIEIDQCAAPEGKIAGMPHCNVKNKIERWAAMP